ncbi:T9SS type A sorting domain-containing protein [Fibrobacterota bacterium]
MRTIASLVLISGFYLGVFAGTHSAYSGPIPWDEVTAGGVGLAGPGISGNIVGFEITHHPFRGENHVLFSLEEKFLKNSDISLKVYTLSGKMVKTFDGSHMGETGKVFWDKKDMGGRLLDPGVYLARLITGNKSYEQKFMLLK